MLLFVGTLITVTAMLVAIRCRTGSEWREAPLGSISERWLHEHRSSQAG
jgi:hypothetical protein